MQCFALRFPIVTPPTHKKGGLSRLVSHNKEKKDLGNKGSSRLHTMHSLHRISCPELDLSWITAPKVEPIVGDEVLCSFKQLIVLIERCVLRGIVSHDQVTG